MHNELLGYLHYVPWVKSERQKTWQTYKTFNTKKQVAETKKEPNDE